MTTAHLGLGGNLGDPVAKMAEALRQLDARPDTEVLTVSRLFRTPPWGKTDQPWFVNACARIETTLQPEALLEACLDTERRLKRERIERWGPRTVDIDVLEFGSVPFSSSRLTVPHPRLTERAFVLVPLADIAADLLIGGLSVRRWCETLPREGIEPLGSSQHWWRGDQF